MTYENIHTQTDRKKDRPNKWYSVGSYIITAIITIWYKVLAILISLVILGCSKLLAILISLVTPQTYMASKVSLMNL